MVIGPFLEVEREGGLRVAPKVGLAGRVIAAATPKLPRRTLRRDAAERSRERQVIVVSKRSFGGGRFFELGDGGPGSRALSEGEDICADAAVEEFDLERSIGDRLPLADELVHPGLVDAASPVWPHIRAVVRSRGESIDGDAIADGPPQNRRRKNHVKVAGVETIGD
jgi:hypothetical protein